MGPCKGPAPREELITENEEAAAPASPETSGSRTLKLSHTLRYPPFAPDFAACGTLPDDSVAVPGGREVLRLHAMGTRNYTCPTPGGVTPIGDGQGTTLARLAEAGSDDYSMGATFYSPEGRVTIVLDHSSTGITGMAEMVTDTAGVSPIFQPSPINGSIAWARWRVIDAGGEGYLANITYMTRVDTSGGAHPERCPKNSTVATVPYEAEYVMYTCTSGGLVARLGALAIAAVGAAVALVAT